jgi:hypothetical protein
VANKVADVCPGQPVGSRPSPLDARRAVRALVKKLVNHQVAHVLPTVFKTFTRPPAAARSRVLLPDCASSSIRIQAHAGNTTSVYAKLFPMRSCSSAPRPGQRNLLAGPIRPEAAASFGILDPAQIELLVEAGYRRAIKIGTLNGATYLGQAARIGSIAPGKQADRSSSQAIRRDHRGHPRSRRFKRGVGSIGEAHRVGDRESRVVVTILGPRP